MPIKRVALLQALAIFVVLARAHDVFAYAGCAQLSGGVDLRLDSSVKRARAAADLHCLAANGYVNYLEEYSIDLTIHQVNPSIDYTSPTTGQGDWYGSLEAPAEYLVKTCYQAFLTGRDPGGASGSYSSAESCTPDPPPPPPEDRNALNPDTGYDPTGCRCNSPIVINLGFGEYQLSSKMDPVTFDIDADGVPNRLAWTSAGAPMAFLALDRNSNGRIDDGSELFGDHTPLAMGGIAANGFEGLAQYDANGDGVIDANDPVWSALMLWTDVNHDGISQASEMSPLASNTVNASGLKYHWTGRRDPSGNIFRYQSFIRIASDSKHVSYRPVYDIFLLSAP